MIQRIQSVWLLLAGACAAAMFFFPIYGGVLQNGLPNNYLASSSYLLFLLAIVSSALPIITIFLFRNRPLQMKLTFLNILLGIALMIMVYFKANDFAAQNATIFKSSSYKVAAALPILAIILSIMAFRGISADQKLVKSTDRLR
jgi:hypothetical protein